MSDSASAASPASSRSTCISSPACTPKAAAGARTGSTHRARPSFGPAVRSQSPPSRVTPDATDLALMTALSTDPRRSAADLACDTELSVTSVRRRLARLDTARLIAYRCDVARGVSGWPVAVNFWAVVPPHQAARIAGQVTALRETRFCASLSGPRQPHVHRATARHGRPAALRGLPRRTDPRTHHHRPNPDPLAHEDRRPHPRPPKAETSAPFPCPCGPNKPPSPPKTACSTACGRNR
jgi:DNA-binding Lrp family transcriptional regulator